MCSLCFGLTISCLLASYLFYQNLPHFQPRVFLVLLKWELLNPAHLTVTALEELAKNSGTMNNYPTWLLTAALGPGRRR